MTTKEHTIDAAGQKVGRVATEAAKVLMGKTSPDFAKHIVADVHVIINNASKAAVDEKKLREKKYTNFSGYPGGLTYVPMEKVVEKKGFAEVFRKAVYGMLPNNKLRARRMKLLTINE